MNILYLHGWNSVVGGLKPTYLKSHGHEVIEPALDHEDFQAALTTAQAAFDQHRPDVVVGSSRGGAVAVNLDSGSARLVLICPAWKKWGSTESVKPGTVILHSRLDDVVPFADSVELLFQSGLPETALIEVGRDHRLADPEPLEALLRAVEASSNKCFMRQSTKARLVTPQCLEGGEDFRGKAGEACGKVHEAAGVDRRCSWLGFFNADVGSDVA